MERAETDMRVNDSTEELSFSIKRILQNKDDKRCNCDKEEDNTGRKATDCCQNSDRKGDTDHSEGLVLLPWQVFNKQANRRIGHPYQSRAAPKRKKPRTTFSRSQISELEELFTEKKYLTSSERQRVATYLQLTDCQVKTWFQNRRTKWKRETDEEKEEQRHAMRRAMISFHEERMVPFQNCL